MSSVLTDIRVERLEGYIKQIILEVNALKAQNETLQKTVRALEDKQIAMNECIEELKNRDEVINYSFRDEGDESDGRVQLGSSTSKNPLNFINNWEVIWAKRYDSEEEKKSIRPGHEEGPFIIIDRDDEALYGIYCTTVVPTYEDRINSSYYIGDAIDCFKESYVDFNQIKRLTGYHYIKKVDKISDKVRNNITKRLSLALQKGYSNFVLRNNSLVYYVKKNEIIKIKDKYFYIVKQDADNYYAREAFKTEDNKNGIKINGSYYTFNLLDEVQIRKVTTMVKNDYNKLKGNADDFCRDYTFTIEAMLDEEEERSYKKYEYAYFNGVSLEDELAPEVYDVVEFDNRLFYIYGQQENDFNIIELFINKKDCPGKNIEEIEIDGDKYYSNFEFLLIEKVNDFNYITSSTDVDRYTMKSQFKYHRKQDRKEAIRLGYIERKLKEKGSKDIDLKHKTLMTDEYGSIYVVITRNYNTLRTVNFCTLEIKDINLDDYAVSPFTFKEIMSDEDYNALKTRMKENDAEKRLMELQEAI